MNTNKKTARIVGVLFITATVTAILGALVLTAPILDDPDYLISVSANENQFLIGVLFELIAAGATVGIGLALFPIFNKHNEALALGYAVGRSIEGVMIIVGELAALLLLTLSREYVAGAPDASSFQSLGTLLLAERDWTNLLGPNIVLSLSTLILSYLFYQSRLVPRWLSVWGLIGAIGLLAVALLIMFGLIAPFSPIGFLLGITLISFEMVLAVWLIVKGFNPSAIASEPAKADMKEAVPG